MEGDLGMVPLPFGFLQSARQVADRRVAGVKGIVRRELSPGLWGLPSGDVIEPKSVFPIRATISVSS